MFKSAAIKSCCMIDHLDTSIVVRPTKYTKYLAFTQVHLSLLTCKQIFCKLQPSLEALHDFLPESSPPSSTSFTFTEPSTILRHDSDNSTVYIATAMPEIDTNYAGAPMPNLRTDRPALLLSSTSWTPDEDFSILLEALCLYEKRVTELTSSQLTSHGGLPKLLVIVTGKGPLKEQYMEEVGKLQKSWKWVRCISLWLEAEDYPMLLGALKFIICIFNHLFTR